MLAPVGSPRSGLPAARSPPLRPQHERASKRRAGQRLPCCHPAPRGWCHAAQFKVRRIIFFYCVLRSSHYFPINIYFYLVPGHLASHRAAGWARSAQELLAQHCLCCPLPSLPRSHRGGTKSPVKVPQESGDTWLLLPFRPVQPRSTQGPYNAPPATSIP